MGMPTIDSNIWEQYGIKHTRILQRELNEDASKMEPYVSIMPGCKGKSMEIPYIGGVDSMARTQRYEKITRSEVMFGNRHLKPQMRFIATKFSSDDEIFNTDIDFQLSHITTEHRSRAMRDKDLAILGVQLDERAGSPTHGMYVKQTVETAPTSVYDNNAGGILGTNYTGITGASLEDLGDEDTGNDLTTNVVPVNFKYSGTKADAGMLLDKIVRAKELLQKRQALVRGMNTCVLALSAKQLAEIQMWEQSQNKNYGFGDLVDGYQNRILGVNIMQTEMLPVVNLGTAEAPKLAQICPVFVKEQCVFGVWDDMKVRIDPHLQDFVDMGQVLTTYAYGAARKYKEGVIQIQCLV